MNFATFLGLEYIPPSRETQAAVESDLAIFYTLTSDGAQNGPPLPGLGGSSQRSKVGPIFWSGMRSPFQQTDAIVVEITPPGVNAYLTNLLRRKQVQGVVGLGLLQQVTASFWLCFA